MSVALDDPPHRPREDPVVMAAFTAMDAADVRWCLLRDLPPRPTPHDDVDLLVHPADRRRADTALRGAGFAPDPRPGLGTHRFHWARGDRDGGGWVKLDVVTDVAFGPERCWRPMPPEAVLARVVRDEAIPRPDHEDAVWLLLAHGLLDRGFLSPDRLAEARRSAALATLVHPIAVVLDDVRPDGAAAADLRAAVGRGDRARLDAVGAVAWPSLLATLPWRERARVRGRALAVRARRRLARTPLLAPRGLTIALLAPDGAGKSTLASALVELWPLPARGHYLGLYPSADPWLHRGPAALRPLKRIARTWTTVVRATFDRARGHLVVLDRHPREALLDQSRGVKARVRRVVFGRLLPAPDLVVVLDAPAEVLAARKPEHTVAELAGRRQRYLALAHRTPGARVIQTDGALDDAVDAIVDLTWAAWRARGR